MLGFRSGPGSALSLSYGPSSTLTQFGTVLVRLLFEFFRVTLARTCRPGTLPKPSTSGRSRSNGSDWRPTLGIADTSENMLVVGRLGPGSPKSMDEVFESRDAALEVALKVGRPAL
jgi:hypothetical protein